MYIKEKSCGAVVYREINNHYQFLLIQHVNGNHWSFPKGHVEGNETEIETALREIKEETGLDVNLNTDFRQINQYSPKNGVMKDVVYFLAQAKSDCIIRQQEEITETRWLSYDDAYELLNYPTDQQILSSAYSFLTKKAL